MSIVRYNNGFGQIIKRLDDIFSEELWYPKSTSYAYNGQWVDTDKYDITPKKEYRQKLIEQKKEKIAELDKRKKELEAEIKELQT